MYEGLCRSPEPHKLGVGGAICDPSNQEAEAEDQKVILGYTGRSAWDP